MQSKKIFSVDLCILGIFAAACIYMFCASIPLSVETKLFPQIVSTVTFVFCMYAIAGKFLGKPKEGGEEKSKAAGGAKEIKHLLFVGVSLLYVLLLNPLGFLIDSICLFIGLPLILGYKNFKVTVPMAVIATLVLYLVFNKAFYVRLPQGLITFF